MKQHMYYHLAKEFPNAPKTSEEAAEQIQALRDKLAEEKRLAPGVKLADKFNKGQK